jgi:hypothetical protein
VVDVRDNAKIARAFDGHQERWGNIPRPKPPGQPCKLKERNNSE